MAKFLVCALFCTLTLYLYPQNIQKINSLKKAIETSTNEKELTWNYYELAKLYVLSNFDSAGFYYSKALTLAKNQDNKKLTTEIYLNISKLQTKQSEYDKAEASCFEAMQLASEINNDTFLIECNLLAARIRITRNDFTDVLPILESTLKKATELEYSTYISECYDAFGTYYFYSDVPKSIEYYIKSLRIIENGTETESLLTRVVNIGSLYGRIGQNDKAIEFLLRGAEIAKKTNQKYVLSTVYNNLAVIYFEIKDNKKSKYYLEEALKIARNLNDEPMVCGIVVNLGELYQDDKEYDIAMDYYKQGLNSPAIENIPDQKIYTLHNIATLYFDLNNLNKAVEYAENALSIAKEFNISMHNSELFKVLSESYEKIGDYEKAFENQKLYKVYNDSLFNIQSTERIAEIQSKYDFDKAENENILLKKDNEIQALTIQKQKNRQLALLGVSILIFVGIVLAYFRIKRDKKTNRLLYEKNNEINLKSEELEKANIAKDKFFSILAHDLRNPFNSILGSLEILYGDYNKMTDKERKHFIHLIHKSAQITNKLLSNLLEWSRTQRGAIKLDKCENNLSSIIAESISLHQSLALKKEISVDNDLEENLMAIFDKKTISIAINNLINNAIKFTPTKGHISVSAERINGCVHIYIKDTGVGISPDALKSLFKIEIAQSTPGTDSEPGTGLGLILCKEFVEKNNGSIHVTSEEGKGSCFKVILPSVN